MISAAMNPVLRPPMPSERRALAARRIERRGGATAAPPALVVERVHKTFGAGVRGCALQARVLAGASLRVRAGEIVGIAGDAGSGKSTLLLCAAGRIRPEQGSVSWPAAVDAAASLAAHPPLYLDLRDALQRRELERALRVGEPLILLDHALPVHLDELRVAITRSPRPRGAVVVASRSALELRRIASRVLVIRDGGLRAAAMCPAAGVLSQRKRSAARASSEFPSALARARICST